jgi:hypothetical protein
MLGCDGGQQLRGLSLLVIGDMFHLNTFESA